MPMDMAAAVSPARVTTGPASPPTAYWAPPSRAEPAPAASGGLSMARLVAVGRMAPMLATQTNRNGRLANDGAPAATAAHSPAEPARAAARPTASSRSGGYRRSRRTVAEPAVMRPTELTANIAEKALVLRPYWRCRMTELSDR